MKTFVLPVTGVRRGTNTIALVDANGKTVCVVDGDQEDMAAELVVRIALSEKVYFNWEWWGHEYFNAPPTKRADDDGGETQT